MRTVMVTKFVPLPADSGGKRRSLALLQRFAARGPTELCAFDDGAADIAGLEAIGVTVRSVPWPPPLSSIARGALTTLSVSAARFSSAALRHEVQAATGEPTDLLQVEYAQLAHYGNAPARFRVLDLHNVESSLVESYARTRGGAQRTLLQLEAARLRRLERAASKHFDRIVVVSDTDRARLDAPLERILVCPNGWEPEPPLARDGQPVVAFVALMSWRPNADAAQWLARDVWPLVAGKLPAAKLLLIGRDPGPDVVGLAGSGIEVLGRVEDVRPHLARASVGVAPLRAGGGSRLKILEALGAGRPVVATTIGAEGLEDLAGEGLVIADEPAQMADAILGLLSDPAKAEALGQRGHAAVRDRYAWDVTLRPLFDLIDR